MSDNSQNGEGHATTVGTVPKPEGPSVGSLLQAERVERHVDATGRSGWHARLRELYVGTDRRGEG